MSGPRPAAAVVFDLDGLLVDSEPLWDVAIDAALADHGKATDATVRARHTGMRIDDVARVLVDGHGLAVDPDAFGRDLLARLLDAFARDLHAMPGADRALDLATAGGRPAAVASSSARAVIESAVARFRWGDRFAALVSADEVARGKPHPDVYEEAARRLGVAPADCVALEDSENGVRAARAAGMTCVGVPGPDAALADAHTILPSLADLTPHHLTVEDA